MTHRAQKARASGLPGHYFLGNYGKYVVLSNGSQVFLGYVLEQLENSFITLTLNADSLKYIINVSVRADAARTHCNAGVRARSTWRSSTTLRPSPARAT